MGDSREQAQFRQHLAEMRRAAAGLGGDFGREFANLDEKIEALGRSTGQGARSLANEIEEDFGTLGRELGEGARRLPQHLADAGSAIGSGTVKAAGAVRDAAVSAGKRAKTGTQNALAAAAGVKRTPMKEWSPPTTDSSSDESH